MKRHIIGLAIFSFIVSTAAIVYAVFNVSEISPVYKAVVTPQYVLPEGTHCKLKRLNFDSIEIRQAVFDVQTQEVNWEIAAPGRDEAIDIHFFSKDEQGTHYITTEKVTNQFSRNGVMKFSSSYSWLKKRNSYDNLYVIAQFDSDAVNYKENYQVYGNKFQPKFDASQATAVTIDYGK